MGEIPEGRKPLTWKDMTPKHSSWEAEAKALRAENERLRAALSDICAASADGYGPDYVVCHPCAEIHVRARAALDENTAALSELRDQARPAKADAREQDMPDGFWDGADMRPAEDRT